MKYVFVALLIIGVILWHIATRKQIRPLLGGAAIVAFACGALGIIILLWQSI